MAMLQRLDQDAELARAALDGDRAALGRLLQRHRPRLLAAALAMLGDVAAANDAVHETFLAALLHLGELRDPRAVGGWLMATLRTRCLLEHRRLARLARDEADRADYPGGGASPEQAIEESALRDWLWGAIGRLGEGPRLAVMLRYFGSWRSYGEIADILGVPVGTVRSRLAEARRRLGGLLLERAGGEERRAARERTHACLQAFHGLYRGDRASFLSLFDEDLVIRWGSSRTTAGREHLAAEADGDIEAGVEFEPRRVLSSGGLTVVEGAFLNPPEDPAHCPPGAAIVLEAPAGGAPVMRARFHYSAEAPAVTPDDPP